MAKQSSAREARQTKKTAYPSRSDWIASSNSTGAKRRSEYSSQ
jgi:hypothetical protein